MSSIDLNVDELNLNDFDINDIDNDNDNNNDLLENDIELIENINSLENLENIEFVNFDNCNIIYSYPFYTEENYDYEYRITIDPEYIILDEVKCNDNEADFDNSIILIKNVFKENIVNFKTKISELIQNESNNDNDTIINLNFDSTNNEADKQQIIEKNKSIVLNELYREVYNSL